MQPPWGYVPLNCVCHIWMVVPSQPCSGRYIPLLALVGNPPNPGHVQPGRQAGRCPLAITCICFLWDTIKLFWIFRMCTIVCIVGPHVLCMAGRYQKIDGVPHNPTKDTACSKTNLDAVRNSCASTSLMLDNFCIRQVVKICSNMTAGL